jgi:hypothetical protein
MDLLVYVASLLAAFGAGAFWAVRPAPVAETRLSRTRVRAEATGGARR